jgi:predicted amidohydrolase YtcJ
MKRTKSLVLCFASVIAFVVASCGQSSDQPTELSATTDQKSGNVAEVIYFGGPIITMVGDGDRAEALAVTAGRIVAVSTRDDVFALRGPETRIVDLEGQTLMPGFIDAHSHVVQQALKFSVVNLDPYPIGDVTTITDIQRKLRQRIDEQDLAKDQWVFGWGYDDTGVAEARHPTREDLDAVSTEHPILLMHISSHLMAANSKALELAGISAETQDPDGGKIQRIPGSNEPNGVLEEKAMGFMLLALPSPTPERGLAMLEYGLRKYAEAGITTAQEGGAVPGMLKLLESGAEAGVLPIDVVSYPVFATLDDATFARVASGMRPPARYRMGGIKLVLDGSIQGYTAYLSKPYHVQPGADTALEADSCGSDVGTKMLLGGDSIESVHDASETPAITGDYRGYPSMTLEEVVKWIRAADEAGMPFLAHTNGDAATDILIEAIKTVRGDRPRPDLRSVIIHAQTMRDDQLDFAAEHGLVPSFFPIHVEFWGDRHRDIFLGPERAARINPARSALDRGLTITLHHDAPVAGIDILNVVSSAVNRRTTSGALLGEKEKITPYEAFRAVTIDAAWQYFEEDRKGTLEEGKLADMVILSDDPLAIDPAEIKTIEIIETIKEGETVYRQGM